MPLNRNDVIQQDFYFCPYEICLSSIPIWSNVRYLHSVDADTGIADSDKDNVAKDLGIVVIQNSYISQLRHAHFFVFFFF